MIRSGFWGEGWRSEITPEYTNLYEPDTKDLVYQTRDKILGTDLYSAKVTELAPGKVRFYFRPLMKPAPGTLIVFFHGRYITDGILLLDSKDISIEEVTIYHTLSCGVAAYRSENIALRNVHIINNDAKDRAFSTVADATHFNGCKGHILFERGVVSGAGDDYMNIHGMYAYVQAILDDYTILAAHNDRFIGFDPGETAWVLDSLTMQRTREVKVVQQIKSDWPGGDPRGHIVRFDRNIRSLIRPGDLLENKDRNPSLTVRNCRMLKKPGTLDPGYHNR